MSRIDDLFGGSVIAGPPPVPAVTFWSAPHRRGIRLQTRQQCAHCVMNVRRWHDEQNLPVEQRSPALAGWRRPEDLTILQACQLITQADGSTLYLCAQHAGEHLLRTTRGDSDG